MKNGLNRKAVFLDRDGTLNVEKGYLCKWEDWEWLPGVRDGLARLSNAGFALIGVSNQSGIARGLYNKEAVMRLHERINADLGLMGLKMDKFYFCPHHPDFGPPCSCRKPLPGMLLTAQKEFQLELGKSWLLGDKCSDIQAALACGCRPLLVETGYGKLEKAHLPPSVPVCQNFSAAVDFILAEENAP